MKCVKCDGNGYYDNPKYINCHSFCEGIESRINCKKCKGSGYVIGNIKDVVSFLKHLEFKFQHDKEYLFQIKQCLDTIENN